jgi:hypothetical protein
MIGDVPCWALDVYSREGRAAFARFLDTDAAATRWVRIRIRPARRVAFLGHIVFRVEGGLVANACDGRSETSFAAKPTSNVRVPTARMPPKSST